MRNPTKRFPQKSKKPRRAAGAAPRKGPHTSVNRSPAQIFSSPAARALVILPKSAVFWVVWMEVCASSCHPKTAFKKSPEKEQTIVGKRENARLRISALAAPRLEQHPSTGPGAVGSPLEALPTPVESNAPSYVESGCSSRRRIGGGSGGCARPIFPLDSQPTRCRTRQSAFWPSG